MQRSEKSVPTANITHQGWTALSPHEGPRFHPEFAYLLLCVGFLTFYLSRSPETCMLGMETKLLLCDLQVVFYALCAGDRHQRTPAVKIIDGWMK